MEAINQILNISELLLERLPQQITPINSTALAAIIIVLSVLSTAPRRLTECFWTVALAMLGVLVLFAPNYAMVLFVIGCGLVGIRRSQYRAAAMQKQLDRMGRAVHELELASNFHLIQSLNSPSPPVDRIPQQDAPSILPGEKIPEAADLPELHVVKSLHRA